MTRRVFVAGGTGFLGSSLVKELLRQGRQVTVLGRDAGRIRVAHGGAVRPLPWDLPELDTASANESFRPAAEWETAIGEHHSVVNLVGDKAILRKFTPGNKRLIRDSRVKTTRRLVEALGKAPRPPAVLLCASAVGYYGSQPAGVVVDETSGPGTGFLAELCHEWENAALRAEALGIRVVLVRLGVVLGAQGGALPALTRRYRAGLGGPIGNGEQGFSFIHIDDAVAAIVRCLEDSTIRGPVNLVAPNPVSQLELSRTLADIVHRPALLRVPPLVMRLAYGEGAEAVVGGQWVHPGVLSRAGFTFRYPELRTALRAALAPDPTPAG